MYIFKKGQKYQTPFLKIYIRKNEFKYARYAIIVPSKIGIAVKRNKIKRYIREWLRARSEPLPQCDILIHFKKGNFKIRNAIEESLCSAWEHIKEK